VEHWLKSRFVKSLAHPAVHNADQLHPQVESVEDVNAPAKSASLNVEISASFPSSEIFGVKLVNGHPSQAVLSISNNEPAPVDFILIGGSLLTPIGVPGAPDPPQIMRNLTAQKYAVQIPAGEKETLTYSFATDMHPQDLTLMLAAVLKNKDGALFTNQFFNETVSVVEPPTSIFDPQM
jgi:hypothetical protein